MGNIKADMSMSLDGFIAGPNDGAEHPLGEGGERLHQWVYGLKSFRETHGMQGGDTGPDDDALRDSLEGVGACVMGNGMFTLGEVPWGDPPPFHAPVFVVTHHPRETLVKKGGTSFIFVTDGIDRAVERAREAANGQDVQVSGGANIIQQMVRSGQLDQLQLHIVPVLLGDGRRLFDNMGPEQIELAQGSVTGSPVVTHVTYRVSKSSN